MNVLIVDDHAINRKLLRVTLEAEGITTVEAANGFEALAILEAGQPSPIDAIVSDIFMPGMDGFRFCHAVRQSVQFRHLPFVIYTSTYTSPSDEKLAFDAGVDRYIRKPCPTATLVGALHDVLAAPEARAWQRPEPIEDLQLSRQYNEALIKKLEDRNADLERAVAQQEVLADLSQQALATSDFDVLLAQAVATVTSTLDLDGCVIWETLPDGRPLRVRAACPDGYDYFSDAASPADVIPDRLSVPIPGVDHPLGLLVARAAAPPRLQADDIHFLEAVANVLAAALRRQQAEEKIQSEARFSAEDPNPVLRVSQEGTLTYANKASQPLLEEWNSRVGAPMPVFWQEQISAAYSRGCRQMLDVKCVERVFSFTIVPITEAGYVNLYGRDVTDRRMASELLAQLVQERTTELQDSEQRFRQVAENIDEVFWMFEPSTHRLVYVSPACDAIWGRSRQELYDRPESFLDTVYPDDREQVQQALVSPELTCDLELRITHPDGGLRWVRLRSFPVHNEQGQVYRIAGIATDRTAQKAAEAALFQAERLSVAGRLAASVAHEINNPLQTVIGCLDLAIEDMDEGSDPREYLALAKQEALRTARIVSQLRSLVRPVQDKHREPTDLNQLLGDVLVLQRKDLETRSIQVTWQPEPGLPLLTVMPDLIRQVFLNMVLNAIDAMPEGGQLRLSIERTTSPPGVSVVVADTGAGIPVEVLPHIFEAFYSTKSHGLGVGLFLSHSIVGQHGGRIEIDSRVRHGSTFKVWLPMTK